MRVGIISVMRKLPGDQGAGHTGRQVTKDYCREQLGIGEKKDMAEEVMCLPRTDRGQTDCEGP